MKHVLVIIIRNKIMLWIEYVYKNQRFLAKIQGG
jgi:hypothetical protein